MIQSLKAALCATGVMLSLPADAATYLTYTFTTQGTGTRTNPRVFPVEVTPYNNLIFSLTFNAASASLNNAGTESEVFTGAGGLGQAMQRFSGGGNALLLTSSDNRQSPSFFERLTVNTNLLQPVGATFGPGSFAVDAANSPVSYVVRNGSIGIEYSGSVIAASAIQFEAATAETGLRIVSAIPEPSTWALMLAGFGMVGYGLRRKRATLALA